MCAMPLAKPPPSARPMRGPPDFLASPLRNHFAVASNQPNAGFISTASILLPPLGRVKCLIYVTPLFRCISASRAVWILSILSVIYITLCSAQPELSGSAEAKLALDRLTVVGSALMIAAHPDDENTALLAYLARGREGPADR